MGIYAAKVRFSGPPPTAEALRLKIEELASRPVEFKPDVPDPDFDYEVAGLMRLAEFPQSGVTLKVYKPGSVAAWWRETDESGDLEAFAPSIEGFDESPGRRTVYLQGYLGQETTLFNLILVALESLGGRPSPPLDQRQRQQAQGPLGYWQLRRRHLPQKFLGYWVVPLWLTLMPILVIPLAALTAGLLGLKALRKIRRALMPLGQIPQAHRDALNQTPDADELFSKAQDLSLPRLFTTDDVRAAVDRRRKGLMSEADFATVVSLLNLNPATGAEAKLEALQTLSESKDSLLCTELGKLAAGLGDTMPVRELRRIAGGTFAMPARVASVYALSHSPSDESTARQLKTIALDRSEDAELRGFAIEGLAILRRHDAVPALARLAESEGKVLDPRVAFWIAFALGELGGKSADAALRTLLDDPRPGAFGKTVADEAREALDRLASEQQAGEGKTEP